ncbi:MAG: hypothetical protein ICV77_03775 [Cyanobacteria bacterium Co-bin8]|nr:hypothetical protein [Cyanobacteria bacterium Co-bin8]
MASWLGGLNTGAAGLQANNAAGNGAADDGAVQDPVGQAGRLVQRQSSPVAATGQTAGGNGAGVDPNAAANGQGQPGATGTTGATGAQVQPPTTTAPAAAPAPANLEAIPALW